MLHHFGRKTSVTLIVSAIPAKTSYYPGEAIDLAGLAVHLDGSKHNVTDLCDLSSEINGGDNSS